VSWARVVASIVAGGAIFLLGAAAHAEGAPAPDPAAIARWCSTEQQGALDLSRELKRREDAISSREAEAASRGAELQAAQVRLDARFGELVALRADIDQKLQKADAEHEARLKAIVQMVEANRPSAVAPMFQQLEPTLAVQVLDRMKRAKAGKLLTALPPAQAASLAAAMATPLELASR
jgi:flagellar motility protein MotE (MotC chaperone)